MAERENDVCQSSGEVKISEPVTYQGLVERMCDDYTQVKITTPNGEEHERNFESEFLQGAGIRAGDKIQLTFTEEVKPGEANIHLQIRNLGPAESTEEILAEVERVRDSLNWDLIREKFGSHI